MLQLLIALFLVSTQNASALSVRSRPADIAFRVQMIDPGFSESVAVADFNKDGRLDILSAEYWYEAPNWTKHKIRDIAFNGSYIDNFSDLPVDVDGESGARPSGTCRPTASAAGPGRPGRASRPPRAG